MHRRFVLVCLGLLFLLTACANAGQSATPDHAANSQASTNSTRAKTANQTVSTGLAHATPTQNGVVTTSSASGSSSASGQTGALTLTLACSGPNAQDGFHVSNSQAHACVYTSPGAHLSIKVSFCKNQPDTSRALQGTFTANSSGFYAWTWKPQTSCQPLSAWTTTVTAQLNGQSAAISEGASAQSSSHSSSSVNVPDGW